MKHYFNGKLIAASGGIPVERPCDYPRKGEGVLTSISNYRVVGKGTKFTTLGKGEALQLRDRS